MPARASSSCLTDRPMAGGVHDEAGVDLQHVPVDADLGPGGATADRAERDHLRVAYHACTRAFCGPNVREAEAGVVRRRVRVERTRSKP